MVEIKNRLSEFSGYTFVGRISGKPVEDFWRAVAEAVAKEKERFKKQHDKARREFIDEHGFPPEKMVLD